LPWPKEPKPPAAVRGWSREIGANDPLRSLQAELSGAEWPLKCDRNGP
jgi:hypothetical protein